MWVTHYDNLQGAARGGQRTASVGENSSVLRVTRLLLWRPHTDNKNTYNMYTLFHRLPFFFIRV